MKVFVLACLAAAVAAQTTFSTQPRDNHCNPGLLASYDLEVVRKPTNDTNFICPGIENNCCTTDSQLLIFKNWVHGNEKARLLHVYKTFIATYSVLFDDFRLVEQMADVVLSGKPSDQVSNCGEMATAIKQLKASALKDQALKLAKRAYRHLYDARRGFYCSLCDASAHANYNTLDGAIHMSYGFCAATIKETLGWSTFRYEHFPKIARLYGHFMATCETNGRYDTSAVLRDDLKFFAHPDFHEHITNCAKNVNEPSAIGLCYDYCSHFNPAKFSRLFEGEFERLLGFRVWLNKLVVGKIFASLTGFSKDDLSFTGRLLAEAKGAANATNATTKSKDQDKSGVKAWNARPFDSTFSTINTFNLRYGTQAVEPVTYRASEDFRPTRLFNYHSSIFRMGKERVYNLADFRRIISTSGLNFLAYGYMMKMTNATLNKLDAQVDRENDARYANVTDVFSLNFGYRNRSVQIIN